MNFNRTTLTLRSALCDTDRHHSRFLPSWHVLHFPILGNWPKGRPNSWKCALNHLVTSCLAQYINSQIFPTELPQQSKNSFLIPSILLTTMKILAASLEFYAVLKHIQYTLAKRLSLVYSKAHKSTSAGHLHLKVLLIVIFIS